MKLKLVFVFSSVLFFGMLLFSNIENTNNQIKEVLNQQVKEWNNGSIEGFMKGYWNSTELKFITSKGIKKGYDNVKNSYLKSYSTLEKMGKLEFINLEFSNIGKNLELVTGNWKVSKINQTDSGQFSLIFKKIKKDWKIIVDHTW